MYSVRRDLLLQSVFQDKEKLTLIQFSFLKTRVFSVIPKLLFLFCVQFGDHAPDMSIKFISFPFFFGSFHSLVFWCLFSPLILREVVFLMVFCHMNFILLSTLNESISIALGSFSFWKNHRFECPAVP